MININPKLIVMKNHILLLSILFLLVGLSISSCKKSADPKDGLITCPGFINNYDSSLIGKWKIVTDSTYLDISFYNNHMYHQGKAGDYFDFRNDGKLYTKEGARMDTTSYQLTSDTTILIPSFGINSSGTTATSFITKLPANNIVIKSSKFTALGGFLRRKVILSK